MTKSAVLIAKKGSKSWQMAWWIPDRKGWLIKEFDLAQSYIPIGTIDWDSKDAEGNFKLTETIGTKHVTQGTLKPGKIYFNVADKSFYKFNGKSFTVVDIAEYQ